MNYLAHLLLSENTSESKRLTRKNNLENFEQELLNNYQDLEHDFQQFFPDLINFVPKNRFKF